MQPEHHAFSPKPEEFRAIVRDMPLREKQSLISHDFTNIVRDLATRSYGESEELGEQADPVLEAMLGNEGKELFEDQEIRNKFQHAIIRLQEFGETHIPKIIESVPTENRHELTLLRTQYAALQHLAPIFLCSFDYFATLDPNKLEELRSQTFDIRTLCQFFDIDHISDEGEDNFQIDGAQTVILFNWIRNAVTADFILHRGYTPDQTTYVQIEGSHIRVNNHSRHLLDAKDIGVLNGEKHQNTGYGLFISAFYASEIGDTIELEQSPIDESDKSRGYQISMTLQRNQSTY